MNDENKISYSGHVKMIELLLKNGADANAVNLDNNTALHLAIGKSTF